MRRGPGGVRLDDLTDWDELEDLRWDYDSTHGDVIGPHCSVQRGTPYQEAWVAWRAIAPEGLITFGLRQSRWSPCAPRERHG
jgi:hypothetical protein